MARIIPGIRPSRIELLKLRRQEEIARKGRDLLEEKLNAMLLEFFRRFSVYQAHREAFEREIAEAYEVLLDAEMAVGRPALWETAYAIPDAGEVAMEERSLLGIRVPAVAALPEEPAELQGYCPLSTPPLSVIAAARFARILRLLLQLAGEEGALRVLEQAITATRRKVNALDLILLPRLRETMQYIEEYLEELEREDLYRRKLTKAKRGEGW